MWREPCSEPVAVMDDASRVIVAGAGLTGLTTACMLQRAGMDVLLLEQDHRPGGAIRTYREQGFVFEAGPNTGVLSCPEAVELIESLSPLCQLETALPEAGCRWVMKGGRFLALPSWLAGFSPPVHVEGQTAVVG